MNFKYLFVICILSLASYGRADSSAGDANATANITVLDCITCMNNQTQINEILRVQKIAQRLEYIKQQLKSNLHVQTAPQDPPKLEALPAFLINQLVNSPPDNQAGYYRESTVNMKQMVLFPEEETENCHPWFKNTVCLSFKFADGILSNIINVAVLWLKLQQPKSQMQNFTVTDKSTLNVKNRDNTRSKMQQVQGNDGWYELDIRDYLLFWQYDKESKTRTFIIGCDDCEFAAILKSRNESTANSFLLLHTKREGNIRSKRAIDCVPGSNTECCRDVLEVDFLKLGNYKMILYPNTFNAFMCRGNCYYHSAIDTEKQYATLMVSLKLNKTSHVQLPATCCTPTKFSSLSVIYATSNSTFEKALIPNMIVESCGCV